MSTFWPSLLVVGSVGMFAAACGDGHGGGSTTTSTPVTASATTSATGSIDPKIAVSGLTVHSIYQAPTLIQNNRFSTTVSNQGTQLLILVDGNQQVRGLTLATLPLSAAAGVVGSPTIMEVGAESTALALVMLTPGILTIAPAETAARLEALKQLPSFPSLVNALAASLATTPLTALLRQSAVQAALIQVVTDWFALTASVEQRMKPSVLLGPPTPPAGLVTATLTQTEDLSRVTVTLQNAGWRYVDVYRRDLDSSQNELAIVPVATGPCPMPGATPVSVGSLFSFTVGAPSSRDDTIDFGTNTATTLSQYWIIGPGLQAGPELPPSLRPERVNAWGCTLVRYFVVPAVSLFGGVLTSNDQFVETLWSASRSALDLEPLVSATSQVELAAALINASLDITRALLSTGALVSSGLISEASATNLTGAFQFIASVMAGANGLGAAYAYVTTSNTEELDVYITNSAPIITSTPLSGALEVGQTYSYQVTATDADSDLLRYSLTTSQGGMRLTSSGLFSWAPTATDLGITEATITVSDGKGGQASQTISFNVSNSTFGSFRATGSMGTARARHTATLLANGKVLITGGTDLATIENPLATAEIYDPDLGAFQSTGSMSTARSEHTATLLDNGKVLITGGSSTANISSVLSDAEVYDPETGLFTSTGDLVVGRTGHTATLLPNGDVLIAGGLSSTSTSPDFASVATAEIYHPDTGAFVPLGNMGTGRSSYTATLLGNGTVLLAGGLFLTAIGSSALVSAELYDPVQGSFSPTGGMLAARATHRATLLVSGEVLVTGGHNGDTYSATADLYDPQVGGFAAKGSMSVRRGGHIAVRLLNGAVLIAGGYSGARNSSTNFLIALSSSELYDPFTETFDLTSNMQSPRAGHAAVLLRNGQVLITGGYDGANVIRSAELFE